MRVKELIKQLETLDPDAEVFCLFPEDNPLQNNGTNIDYVFELKGAGKENDGVYIKEK